jgi:hypothetical protein
MKPKGTRLRSVDGLADDTPESGSLWLHVADRLRPVAGLQRERERDGGLAGALLWRGDE